MTEITTAGYNALKSSIKYDAIRIELATGEVEFILKDKVVGRMKITDSFRTNDTVTINNIRGKIVVNGVRA